jgi:hypothetical protein
MNSQSSFSFALLPVVFLSVSFMNIWITGYRCQNTRGVVSAVYDAGLNNAAVKLTHDTTTYYISLGKETTCTVRTLKRKLVGKTVVLSFTFDSLPLPRLNRNTPHIIKISVNGENISSR